VHGFLLKKKKYKTLDLPGATATVASGINIKGDIVLYWAIGGGATQTRETLSINGS